MEAEIREYVRQAAELNLAEERLLKKINKLLIGKKITVTNERFNGQMHGQSWPRLKGRTFTIDHAILWKGKVEVWFPGPHHYTYMPLSYGVVTE